MKIRYIPAGIALVAGAITCLICLMRGMDTTYSLELLLIVLIIFTVIGMKAQSIILNVMHEQKMEEEEAIRLAEFKEAERIRKLQMGEVEEEQEEQEEQEEETEEGQQEEGAEEE